MRADFVLNSESVSEGHPDKLCDQISDAVLDHFLLQDPFSNVVVECAVANAILFVAARFQSRARVDIPSVARSVVLETDYDRVAFDPTTCTVVTSLNEIPVDAEYGRDERELDGAEIDRIPARNQVNVFGFACQQTDCLMPLPIWLAHRLARRLAEVRRARALPYLTPDGKTQVGVEFRNRKPHRIHGITVIASQTHASGQGGPNLKQLQDDIRAAVIEHVFRSEKLKPDARTRILVNPDGPFVLAGPACHSGLTGRKNGVDTYGEYSRHSGAALSGKSPMRIDRIGAYAARYAAKNVVAAGLAEECEVLLSYNVGLPQPACVQIETFGTGRIPDSEIARRVIERFDFRPAGIVRQFNLRQLPALRPEGFYRRLAVYGHVGRPELDLPWESVEGAGLLTRP